jgi:tryptophanyl-tRNA synthetase
MESSKGEFKVTPWEATGTIDYEELARQFGIRPIDKGLEERIKKHTGELHFLMRRNIFFAQRELGWLLDEYEKGNKFYIYTGIAPSGNMHIGHLLPFVMAKWLQEKFDAEVLIQIPDEEKFLSKKKTTFTLEQARETAYDDALTIMALGFDPKKTKIFLNTEYASTLYRHAVRVARHVTFSMVKDAFGMGNDSNIGWIFYTSMQAVPAFLKSVEEGRKVPCLIPLGVDQDVHFRIARDTIEKLGYYKPAIIHNKFMPGLDGSQKMSASEPMNAIYLNDTPEAVHKKVMRAFTGQQSTAELQRKLGGNPDVCAVCQYYRYFFEPDDRKLKAIMDAERSGTMLAGEHKEDLAKRVNAYLQHIAKEKERLKPKLDQVILRG